MRTATFRKSASVFFFLAVLSLTGAEKWCDSFYSCRIPVSFTVPAPGRYRLQLDPGAITERINAHEIFKFKKNSFAYPFVRIAVDGEFIDGAYALYPGKELLKNGDFSRLNPNGFPENWAFNTGKAAEKFSIRKADDGKGNIVVTKGGSRYSLGQSLDAAPDTWYRFISRAKGISRPHVSFLPKDYNDSVPVDGGCLDPLVRSDRFLENCFFFGSDDLSGWRKPVLDVRILNYDSETAFVSLRECALAFTAEFKKAGPVKAMLYYTPVEGPRQCPPPESRESLPAAEIPVEMGGAAEKYPSGEHFLAPGENGTFWQAPVTDKILPSALPPAKPALSSAAGKIEIAAARNEQETFQLVFTPVSDGILEKADCFISGIPKENITVRTAEYVMISQPSSYASGKRIIPHRSDYTGPLPDPLPLFRPSPVRKGNNRLIWVNVKVPADTPAGIHPGEVQIAISGKITKIPVSLRVWSFSLPEIPACRTMLAFSQYANLFLFPFHGAKSRPERHAVSRAYIEEMARYRINVKHPAAAGVWNPELPEKPSLEEIYDKELSWSVNNLHLPRYLLNHIGGRTRVTPEQAEKEAETRDGIMKFLAEKKIGGEPTVWFDEPMYHEYPYVKCQSEAYKKREYSKNLHLMCLIYHGYAYDLLRGIADEIVMLDNENGTSVSKEGFALFGKGKCWTYLTRSSILWIDAPGLTNRFWAVRNYAAESSGFAIWATNVWWNSKNSPHKQQNPWIDPSSTWGNGALAFFYPPDKQKSSLDVFDPTVTPSLRLVLYRDGLDDYDYAVILRDSISRAEKMGKNVSDARKLLTEFTRPFITPQNWSLNEAWWRELRLRIGSEIEKLN